MNKVQVITLTSEGKLVVAMVSTESVAASSTPFGAATSPKRNVYFYDGKDVTHNTIPTMLNDASVMSDETITEYIDAIVEGIPPAKSEGVRQAIMSSNNQVDGESFSYTPNKSDEDELRAIYDVMVKQLDDMKSGGSGAAADGKLAKYFFKKHILLKGEKGGGKTYMVTKMIAGMAADVDSVDIRGHEGMEATDLLGYYIKTDSGNLVWKDGPLTQAFRNAAKGRKTILFIDETLRIPKRELNVLVGAISPDYSGNFVLDTNQADTIEVDAAGRSIANVEKLTVPKDMLWVVGTTNAGAGYAVDQVDEALADRFRIIVKRTGEKEMQTILTKVSKDFGHDKKQVKKLMGLYKSFNTLKESGELTKLINLRHLCEILEFSEPNDLVEASYDLIPTWCSDDQNGYPNETQEAIIEGIIEKELV